MTASSVSWNVRNTSQPLGICSNLCVWGLENKLQLSLLVSAVRCCAGARAAKKQPNDSKRDGIGLPEEF